MMWDEYKNWQQMGGWMAARIRVMLWEGEIEIVGGPDIICLEADAQQ